ncbi:MAG: carbohydrate kinase family protein [Bacilli bacterium]|nr:carbohydrate kinase family protein [Bacilli bacterium]
MKKILVSGLVNIETSLKVDSFPINYCPIEYPFFGVDTCVSGVGYNVSKAIKTLGGEVDLLSLVGDDLSGEMIKKTLEKDGINYSFPRYIKQTPTSVVLVDKDGKRKIYCDLKDIQDSEPLDFNLENYSLLALTNINFNRHLLKAAKDKNIHIATDVHVLSNIDDEYNQDFLNNANILFLSNEAIRDNEEEFVKDLYNRYHNDIIVVGCGEEGAILYEGKNDKFYHKNAVAPKGVVSTVGAGDALFSAFIYFYNKGENVEKCLQKAVLFAGLKISSSGGSNGFVNEEELLTFVK